MRIKSVAVLAIGLLAGYTYSEYNEVSKQNEVYGARNVESDVKKELSRVNTILDEMEKKHIKKINVPKPSPPQPEITCKCNGTGVIVQPDGNKVQCQCSKDGGICQCKSKETSPELIQPQLQPVLGNP